MIVGMADESKQEAAAPSVGRVVHFHPADPEAAPLAAVVVALASEGGDGAVDLFVLPTRHYQGGTVLQAVRHDDEHHDVDEDLADATDEERAAYYARGRTSQIGSWGWPPRV